MQKQTQMSGGENADDNNSGPLSGGTVVGVTMSYVGTQKFTFISVASAFVFGAIIGFAFGLIPFARQVERIEIEANYHKLHLDRALTCEQSLFTCLQGLLDKNFDCT
jgi:hypothetical protein